MPSIEKEPPTKAEQPAHETDPKKPAQETDPKKLRKEREAEYEKKLAERKAKVKEAKESFLPPGSVPIDTVKLKMAEDREERYKARFLEKGY